MVPKQVPCSSDTVEFMPWNGGGLILKPEMSPDSGFAVSVQGAIPTGSRLLPKRQTRITSPGLMAQPDQLQVQETARKE